jgi:hypothetical protein
MATLVWVVIAIVVVVAAALVAVAARKRRSAVLRDRFGPEYDRVVESSGDQRAAEAELRDRERQRAQFEVEPLPEAARLRFAGEWRDLQERFVDEPAPAAAAADALVTQVMEARGYPVRDFDAQADLVSVDYPGTVEDYRFAHAVQLRSQAEQASTEDLREALLRYRSLFDELLRPEGNGAAVTTTGREQRAAAQAEAQVPEASAAGQADGLQAEGDTLPDAAAPDTEYAAPATEYAAPATEYAAPATDYNDEQIGR